MLQQQIQDCICYALRCGLIEPEDEIILRNQLLDLMRCDTWEDIPLAVPSPETPLCDILEALTLSAVDRNIIDDTAANREAFFARVMGLFTPLPHVFHKTFSEKYALSPKEATDWYYDICKNLGYVRADRIARDIRWSYESRYGTLDITINRSKPEKDPRDIAKAGAATATHYPKCQLCIENAGYAGRPDHPARQNLRPIPVTIHGAPWQLQFSPYGYYPEHCILLNELHTPMRIDADVFEKLFDAVDLFPHYFFGSNADLPIVGGSILSHEHFQGGRYTFAMNRANEFHSIPMNSFPDVSAGIVDWAMSAIRLTSSDRHQLARACNHILEHWRRYSDISCQILAETNVTPHNTITPIARKSDDAAAYVCDLVLRNNRTTPDRPLGLFHPNPSLHHIKKENIGLIEVMGLAILPGRLATELDTLGEALASGKDPAEIPAIRSHALWANDILARHNDFSRETAQTILRQEVGAVFENVLEDAAVFKHDAIGRKGFETFFSIVTQ